MDFSFVYVFVGAHGSIFSCMDPNLMLDVFLSHFAPNFMSPESPLNQEFPSLSKLHGHQCPGQGKEFSFSLLPWSQEHRHYLLLHQVFLYGHCESELRCSCVCRKYFTHQSVSPAPILASDAFLLWAFSVSIFDFDLLFYGCFPQLFYLWFSIKSSKLVISFHHDLGINLLPPIMFRM